MASTKSRPKKLSPATPKVSSNQPQQNARRSSNSKLAAVERKSPTLITTTPDKQAQRVGKGSELQTQLNLAQEDLKKSKEQLIQAEKEKEKAIEDLKEAEKVAGEANEKFREALMAQKWAEENSEIEKFRALELEQVGIEATKQKEEEWRNELESVRNQHALDVAALLTATQELQRVKHELSMACDAKKQALSDADDATKIAEIHIEKSEILSAELLQLKSLLNSKLETEAIEKKTVFKLKSEIETLKQELEKAKGYEEKLTEKETAIEQLNLELEAAKMAELYAHSLLEEWKEKVEELELGIEEANKLKRTASESLESVMKQLEGKNDSLHDAESEIANLKEKVGLLEMTIGRQRGDLEDSQRHCVMAKEEISEISKQAESLKSELERVKEEKIQALYNEKVAASSVQTLLEEKKKLINELEISRDEEEKSKKAMESLVSALHEVSAEAREAKEKLLLSSQAEHESHETQIEELKLVLKASNEKYESMLYEARHEIDVLKNCIEKSKNEFENSKAEWEQRELHLVSCLKKTEEENSSLGIEVNRLVYLLKQTEEEAIAGKKEEALLKEDLKEVEAEVIHLQEALKEANAVGMKLKKSLSDKENELQNILQENENRRIKEAASIKKVEELSKLLEECTAQNQIKGNEDLTDREKDCDLLTEVFEFSKQNGHGKDMSKEEVSEGIRDNLQNETNILLNDKAGNIVENVNGNLGKEKELESFEEEVVSKGQKQLKKKKSLLGKFGKLLKKKGTGNQK